MRRHSRQYGSADSAHGIPSFSISQQMLHAVDTAYIDSTYGSYDPSPEASNTEPGPRFNALPRLQSMFSVEHPDFDRYIAPPLPQSMFSAEASKIDLGMNNEEDSIRPSKRPRLDEDSKPAQVSKRRKPRSKNDSDEVPKAK
ncbi:hypothetical protein CTA1_1803 [Colletotrichum tanaceti]|uniref:Uncharacterized protein n=1 Tax=Colletotrichum tanaceti TaxID=1306861 RepID=A0A4U6XL41_9PEZI|nr:hypothetical protein CTA1_1803 [Colletotrichum tanaceti]